jgi:hypothetical protein
MPRLARSWLHPCDLTMHPLSQGPGFATYDAPTPKTNKHIIQQVRPIVYELNRDLPSLLY